MSWSRVRSDEPERAPGLGVDGQDPSPLESNYDLVVIDTPPVLPVTDALLIGVNVDAVVVVARLGQTTRDRIRRTTAALAHVNATYRRRRAERRDRA